MISFSVVKPVRLALVC